MTPAFGERLAVQSVRKASKHYFVLGVVLAALSGAMLAFALPPREVSFLGWLAFLPLLVAARISKPLVAAVYGLLCSLVCALIMSGHLTDSHQFGNLFGAFGTLGLVLAFGAGFASLTKRMNPAVQPLFVACAGVTAELVSVWIFPVNAAISQYRNPAMLELASYTAIWGVSFLVWFVPAAMIAMFQRPKAAWPAFALAAIAVGAGSIAGFPIENKGRVLRVAAIQSPYPDDALKLTHSVGRNVVLVVWPEHRLDPGDGEPSEAARTNRVYVVADFIVPRPKAKPYNTAYLISPSGQVIGKQTKRFLFGNENSICSRGTGSHPVNRGGFVAGMAICYDTQFTGVIRDLVRRGADIICVPVNDPEMPNSLLNHLHCAVVPFRAAENGVPIVWAERNGLSAVIGRSGRILARAAAGSRTAVVAPVWLRQSTTFATRWGDWFGYLCAVGFAAGVVCVWRGKRSGSRSA